MHIPRISFFLLLFLLPAVSAFAQQDSRYASDMNLPFNDKAGDYNPQTGDVTLSAADVSLPGRAGYNFSFGRVWNASQAMAFNMYYKDGENRLDSNTIERVSRLGVGWRSSLPYLMFTKPEELSSDQDAVLNLFYGGGVYEVDKLGITHQNATQSNLVGYDLLDLRLYEEGSVSYGLFGTSELALLKSAFPTIADNGSDACKYVLILKTKEKYFFRTDGQLLMQQDRTGLNRIWYFYESDGGTDKRLRVVVDTIGRKIRFSYNAQGLVSSVEWDVSYGKKTGETREWVENETRSVTYEYASAETEFFTPAFWSEWSTSQVLGYKTPYLLAAVKDEVDLEKSTGIHTSSENNFHTYMENRIHT